MAAAPIEDSDLERFQRMALMMAQQSNACVSIVLCMAGQCREIARACPAEGSNDET